MLWLAGTGGVLGVGTQLSPSSSYTQCAHNFEVYDFLSLSLCLSAVLPCGAGARAQGEACGLTGVPPGPSMRAVDAQTQIPK